MFAFLYTLVIHLFVMVARFAAFFHKKTRKWVEGQKHITQLLKKKGSSFVIPNSSFTLWFHAASLGEFEQGRPVIEAVRKQYPEATIVLTFFSPSGYEIRKDYDQVNVVSYLPADTPANVNRFLDTVQPDMALFIKYEFWHNYLQELKKRHIPTLLFSAIFRPEQLFFKSYGGFYRNMLFCFNRILVQNRSSEELLHSVGYSQVTVAGDTRLDRVAQIAAQAKTYPLLEAFKGSEPLLIAGSVWPDDMEVLIPFLNHRTQPLKVIIAPHEINAEQIEKWQSQLQKSSVRFTIYRLESADSKSADSKEEKNNSFDILHSAFDILFLDTVGMLSSVYRYADFGYIGGAFGDGLHNILEPAVFGMPVFFGQPHYQKFQEAHDLLHLGGAATVADSTELETVFKDVYENPELRQQKARICSQYISQNAGATEKVMLIINEELLSGRPT
ncbi:MAG: glycosyltransferase N-terminal domain-containing protein [Spirosomataceae bacterium]